MPKRIQRKREKGWRMPPNAVFVGPPSRWANPFWHVTKFHGLDISLALYRNMVNGTWSPSVVERFPDHYAHDIYKTHQNWMLLIGGHPSEMASEQLRGKDLVCWCRLDRPCHADILLEVANEA